MKTVYIAISADILHHGHINLIKKASEYGKLIVGVLTDEAVATYKRFPVIEFEERKFIIENIRGVSEVVPQNTLDYTDNLKKYKPDEFPFDVLKEEYGIFAVRGPRGIPHSLSEALK